MERICENCLLEIISRTRDLISRLVAIPQGFAKKRFAASDASNPVPLIRPLKMNITSKREVGRAHADRSNLGIMRGKVPTRHHSYIDRTLARPFSPPSAKIIRAGQVGNQIRFLPRPSSREEETKGRYRESGKVTSGQRLVKGMKKGA